jgi:hypothetical protein
MIHRTWLVPGVAVGLLSGCGGSTESPADAGGPDASQEAASSDAGPSGQDASPDVAVEAASRNSACTPLSQQTGTVIDTDHGRLDGTLVYVLPLGGSMACNGDESHVHLQIEVSGLVYDVAVDVGATGDEVGTYEETLAVPGGAWAEGWHGTDSLSYLSLGVKASQMPIASPSDVATQVESILQSTSQISIFCTGYTQDNGCHDVHYENGNGEDGAIVLEPTAAMSPILFFRFQDQTF